MKLTKLYYWAGVCLICSALYMTSGAPVSGFFFGALAIFALVIDLFYLPSDTSN